MMDLACSWDRDLRRYEDNIKIDISETGYEEGRWLELTSLCPLLPQYLKVGCK
jgi:hypothetical protein